MIYLQMISGEADRTKFEQVYLKYRSLMFYTAEHILHNSHDAEDAVHDAFVAIAKLSPRQRQVMFLKYQGGYTNQEVADMLGVVYDTVRRLDQQAKTKLKKCLEEDGITR